MQNIKMSLNIQSILWSEETKTSWLDADEVQPVRQEHSQHCKYHWGLWTHQGGCENTGLQDSKWVGEVIFIGGCMNAYGHTTILADEVTSCLHKLKKNITLLLPANVRWSNFKWFDIQMGSNPCMLCPVLYNILHIHHPHISVSKQKSYFVPFNFRIYRFILLLELGN